MDDFGNIPVFILEDKSNSFDSTDEDLGKAITIIDNKDEEYDEGNLGDYYIHEVYAMLPGHRPSDPTYQPITREELLMAQL